MRSNLTMAIQFFELSMRNRKIKVEHFKQSKLAAPFLSICLFPRFGKTRFKIHDTTYKI